MVSKVRYLGDLRTEMVHLKSNTAIQNDAPTDNHGKGETFSPTDMLSTSLASCMLTVMGIGAAERDWDITGAEASVTKIMASGPRRVAAIEVSLTIPERNLTADDKAVLEAIGRSCPVAKSLHPDLDQRIEFTYV